ncbi:hypothetical protein [Escherichia coli]|nr:hypothetical protein [Escherichia coli]
MFSKLAQSSIKAMG